MLLPVVWLAGCCSTPPTGHIYVNHPEVFTRERLVDRRLADLQWLEGKLNQSVGTTFQSARSQSQFTGFAGQLSAQFDPLAAAGAVGNLQTLQSAQQAVQLQNQLVTTALQQKLQDLQTGKLGYSNVLGSGTVAVTNLAANTTSSPTNATAGSISLSNLPGLPNATNIVLVANNGVQLTPTEQFRDQLAYRDAVSAEMRERELDDTHDRSGMTLYTLKFDLSLIPGKHNHSLGQAELILSTDTAEAVRNGCNGCALTDPYCTRPDAKCVAADRYASATSLYNKWVLALRRNFDNEVISVQRRFLQDLLTEDEERRLIVRSWAERSSLANRVQQLQREMNRLQDHKSSDAASLEDRMSSLTNQVAGLASLADALAHLDTSWREGDTNILKALANLVTAQFSNALQDTNGHSLVWFGAPRLVNADRNDFRFLVPVAGDEAGPCRFAERVAKLQRKAHPFVCAVEPKESAQNLSDTSAKQTALNLSLALSLLFLKSAPALEPISTTSRRTSTCLRPSNANRCSSPTCAGKRPLAGYWGRASRSRTRI